MNAKYIIIVGDIVSGFKFYGPIDEDDLPDFQQEMAMNSEHEDVRAVKLLQP